MPGVCNEIRPGVKQAVAEITINRTVVEGKHKSVVRKKQSAAAA